MRKIIGTVCMALGVILIASAAALLFLNRAGDRRAGEAAADILPQVRSAIPERQEAPEAAEAVDFMASSEMTVVEIDGYGYIGCLSIPTLELELPVMSEWDYDRLKTAPCLYYGSVKTNDMVIAAHNYTQHFGKLSRLVPGDLVVFTDMDGLVYTYEVGCVETLPPTATEEMIQSQWDLTLYTCTYGGASRVTVRCRRWSASPST